MNCDAVGRWIGALLDGELDAKNASEVQAHLAGCPACQRQYEVQQALSANVRRLDLGYAAPESLRRRIGAALEEEAGARNAQTDAPVVTKAPATLRPQTRGPSRWLMWAGWPVALAASAMLATVLLQQRSVRADDVVAAHVRSLLASHLNDVVSTDHHTVKPWFAGKIDFSPPVPDLSARGFELVGGRLDYLQRQPVAAVIYRKHGHIINVLISRPGGDLGALPHTDRVEGYSLRSWHQAGLDLVAVSDIDPLELVNLEQGYEAPASQAPEPAG
jgi:mycothiol system anti-sigma-R factor